MHARWLQQLRLGFVNSLLSHYGARRRTRASVGLEPLEDRCLLAVFNPLATVADGAADSLRAAIQAANNNGEDDVINLQSGTYDLTLDNVFGQENEAAEGDLDLTEAGQSVTVNGRGAGVTIVNQEVIDRVIQIFPDVTVILNDLTLSGGEAVDDGSAGADPGVGDGNGGGILNGGTLILNAVQITGNTALGDDPGEGGGGLYNSGTANINGGAVDDNAAVGDSGSGGGILNGPDGFLNVTDTLITLNTANRAGGGIEDTSGRGGAFTLTGVQLNLNSAGNIVAAPGNGGGVHITGPGDVLIEGGTVNNNFAALEGGGLWNGSGTMTVNGAVIIDNQAHGDAADDGGGGIFNNGGTLDVTDSLIQNNIADGTAGSGGGILSIDGDVHVVDSIIDNNVANRAGGGVEIINGFFGLKDSNLDRNIAGPPDMASPGNGGGLHITGPADVLIEGGTVNDNFAALEGGGLWNGSGTMTVREAVIVGNQAHGDAADDGGGGIFNNGGTLDVFDSLLEDNIADGTAGSGGGILSVGGDVHVVNSDIVGNVANRAGGGVEIINGSFGLKRSYLGQNVAGPQNQASPGNGGGLHVTGTALIDIFRSDIEENFAASEGGGLWNQVGSEMLVDRSIVRDNVASGDDASNGGGGVFNNGGTLTIRRSEILNNIADGTSGSGGGIFSTDGDVDVIKSQIEGNVAYRAGGGVEIINGFFGLNRSNLAQNIAGPQGLASPGNGGGLHVTGSDALVEIFKSDITGNSAASEGGGLWNQAGSEMVVTRSDVEDNVASGNDASNGGGGIFNNGGTLTIGKSDIVNNVADGLAGSGGGIFSTDGDVNVQKSEIEGNVANRAGGGVEIVDGFFGLTHSDLDENIAGPDGAASPGNGGGLHVTGVALIDIFKSDIEGNVAASEGGGLWNQAGSEMLVERSDVEENVASGDDATNGGGGIFNNGGTLTVIRSDIEDNIADGLAGSGGGILSTDGTVQVERSDIDGNVANRAGGGVEIITGFFGLRHSDLEDNIAGPQDQASPGNGGGLHVSGADALVEIFMSDIDGNIAASEGGGLWNQAGSEMVVEQSEVEDNIAAGNDVSNGGGGIFDNGGTLTVLESVISDNIASGTAGGGGGVFLETGTTARIADTNVSRNHANGVGGGIFNDGLLDLNTSSVRHNSASNGGGVFTGVNGMTNLNDVLFRNNDPDDFAGPGAIN